MTSPDQITGPVKIQISGPEKAVIALAVAFAHLNDESMTGFRDTLTSLGVALSGHADRPRNRKNQAAGTSVWEVTFDAKPAGEQR